MAGFDGFERMDNAIETQTPLAQSPRKTSRLLPLASHLLPKGGWAGLSPLFPSPLSPKGVGRGGLCLTRNIAIPILDASEVCRTIYNALGARYG